MKKHTKKAFTLVEILVVMGIIAVLLGGVSMLKMQGSSQLTGSAQQVLISAFSEAKNLASSRHSRTRVLIYKGSDDLRRLRHIAVLYEEVDEDGDSKGWITSSETNLPNGAFFVPPKEDFDTFCTVVGGYNISDAIMSTFNNGASGVSNTVSIKRLSIKPETMTDANGDWYSYEFAPEGFSENAGSWVLVAAGKMDVQGKLRIENPKEQLGFVVRKFGNCIGFSDYMEMKDSR